MKIEDFVSSVRELTDEELQEELSKLRAARKMRPEKVAKRTTTKKEVNKYAHIDLGDDVL